MNLSIQPQTLRKACFFSFCLVILGFCLYVLLKSPSPDAQTSAFILSEQQLQEVERFKEKCYKNKLFIDSMNIVYNTKYNYPFEITVRPVRDILPFDFRADIPYYGMTDGYNAYVFSLHFQELHEATLHYLGDNIYTVLGNDFLYISTAYVRVPKGDRYIPLVEAKRQQQLVSPSRRDQLGRIATCDMIR